MNQEPGKRAHWSRTSLCGLGRKSLAVALLTLAPLLANASALEQFKSFVAATKSAKGEFTQRLVKTDKTGGAKV